MDTVTLPSPVYRKLFQAKRIGKFTKVPVSSFFGLKTGALYLRTAPIEDTRLHLASPGYETDLSVFYPVYVGEIVMLGYLILAKGKNSIFTVESTKVIIRKDQGTNKDQGTDDLASTTPFERGFISKQMLMLKNSSVNLFIPAVKYLD